MRSRLAFQLAFAGLLLVPATIATASKTEDDAAAEETHTQIVRLSMVDGDVRIARDQQQGQARSADWEKAVSGLPLDSGFTVATDSGRAVIEFQDASTLYLAPNSVLVLSDLTTTGNTPNTEIALLTGTATIHVHPVFAGERFVMRTPTDTMTVSYPNRNDFRVTAYMDALALTPLSAGAVMPGDHNAGVGQTLYYRAGKPVTVADKGDAEAMGDWDKWVAQKYSDRVAAYSAVMQDGDMKALAPGLDSLAGKGKFVDCGEYGKCWQPPQPTQAELQAAAQAQGNEKALVSTTDQASTNDSDTSSTQPTVIRKVTTASGYTSGGGGSMLAYNPLFPCGPDAFYDRFMMYQYSGMMPGGMYAGMMPMGYYSGYGAFGGVYDPTMWSWAVCHTGSWIFQNNQYLWVPGSNYNYQPPVKWVKWGNKQGYVPIHPHDVAGQSPVNLRNGLMVHNGRNSFASSPIQIDNTHSVKLLHSAPRGFREGYSIALGRVDSPHMTGRVLGADGSSKGLVPGNARTVGLTFDHDRGFMVARPVGGSSARTVKEPVGSFLVRSGVGGFGGPVTARGFEGGMRGGLDGSPRGNQGAFNGGARGVGGNPGEFRGGAVFNGGASRGGAEMGGNFGGMGGGPRGGAATSMPGGGSYGGGNMGGGGGMGGGGSMGGGAHAGGGGGFGGGNMGGGGGGGGRAAGAGPSGH